MIFSLFLKNDHKIKKAYVSRCSKLDQDSKKGKVVGEYVIKKEEKKEKNENKKKEEKKKEKNKKNKKKIKKDEVREKVMREINFLLKFSDVPIDPGLVYQIFKVEGKKLDVIIKDLMDKTKKKK